MKIKIRFFTCIVLLLMSFASCKKMIAIDPPVNTVTSSEVFRDSANASSAILGVYANMANGQLSFMNGRLTLNLAESADELVPYISSGDKFYSNTITFDYIDPYSNFWSPAYRYIYQTNAIIEGVQTSKGISDATKKQFLGEAKFLRSLCYFYLINLFGDVPLVTTTDYNKNAQAFRTPKAQIYQQIIGDLKEAENSLRLDYSISGNDRIRANKWAASALLARVYLYYANLTGNLTYYGLAETESTSVINNTSLFNLDNDLNKVFLTNALGNNEAILQWQLNTLRLTFNATPEGIAIIPNNPPGNSPKFYMSGQLLNAFENGDQRKVAWVDSTTYGQPNIKYFFPNKYKIGRAQAGPNFDATEYIMVLRLAELYLIRAEANAQQNKVNAAISDLNTIRNRAGLPNLSSTLSQSEVLHAVMQERRIELFAEWGHRWLDLKRTGEVDSVMNVATPLKRQGSIWQSYQQLYPIAPSELQYDRNLIQNPGY